MPERSHEQMKDAEPSQQEPPAEKDHYGSLTVEDDPDGTTDPTDLAGSATADDAQVGPAASEAN